MNYLENEICIFKPLFKINYNIKKNIIVCCLFKIYKGGYQSFDIYITGLSKLYNYVQLKCNNFVIRLFIDNSIYKDEKIMSKIYKFKKIELVLYTCPDYIIDNTYHYGLLGTLIRFFPIFNFKNNDADLVIICDVDFDHFFLNSNLLLINKLKLYDNYKDYYMSLDNDIYKELPGYNKYYLYYKNKFTPYTNAQGIIGIKKINNSIIINFIKSVKNSNVKLSFYNDKNIYNYTNFIYGVDEYFLNITLVHYLIDNKFKYINNIKFNLLSGSYFYSKFRCKNNKTINDNLFNKFINLIFDKFKISYTKSESPIDKFNRLDKLIYNIKLNKSIIKIYKFLYKIMLKLYNNKEYSFLFPQYLYKILLTKMFFGIYNLNIINFEFGNDETIIINKDQFNSKYMQYLYEYLKKKNIELI